VSDVCAHPVAPGVSPCPICELEQEHAEGQHQYGCICPKIGGAYVTEHYEVVAEDLVTEAVRLYSAAGKGPAELESTLRWQDYSPALVRFLEDEDALAAFKRIPYSAYLASPEWAEQRRRALVRANGACQTCERTDSLETHHRTYERRGDEQPNDLIVLCVSCHTAVHLAIDARKGKLRKVSRRAASVG
jgi:HNH endonuclease